jgi:hypothetical protein
MASPNDITVGPIIILRIKGGCRVKVPEKSAYYQCTHAGLSVPSTGLSGGFYPVFFLKKALVDARVTRTCKALIPALEGCSRNNGGEAG